MIDRRHLFDRRHFLSHSVNGLGGVALASLLGRDGLLADELKRESAPGKFPVRPEIDPARPYAPRLSHHPAKAKQVLMIFCSGAISQVDTWDYKPELIKRHGQPMPGGDKLITFQGAQGNLMKSPWEFKPRGQSGKMVTDLIPRLGELADEMCFLHGLTGKTNTHGPGENFMCTGFTLDGFPSAGAWTTYALGSEAEDLPAYVAIPDVRGTPQSSVNCWGPGFLPAAFQGTSFNAAKPVRNIAIPNSIGETTDAATRAFLQRQNQRHLQNHPEDSQLAARIASYELAARMQMSIPELSDLSREPDSVLKAYGASDTGNKILDLRAAYGRNCILARRLIERGVRFVQLFNGAYQTGGEGVSNWDGHKKIKEQ
ncbi:MAG: DUF1501 domain-containing protein, partial [Akkermansiaceae bacterium]